MAIDKLNFNGVDIGKVDLPSGKFADTLMQYGQQLNETERQRRLDAQNALSMQMNQARFAREQELNKRNDTEYNREIGLRDTRQNLSKEFLANPYAAKFGSGRETALLDKQVNDYVNRGGEINEDMARRLQAKYEEARPFREDATNALTSQMVLAGEDPTKAAQTGAALGSNLLSRVEQQAAVSANRKIEQDQYDEAAKRNKEALQLRFDIAKANSENDKDKAELLFKQYQNMNGGTGGGSSGTNVLMETLSKIGPLDAAEFMAKNGPRELAIQAGYTDAQIAKAAGQGLDTDPTAWTFADNTIDVAAFTRNLKMQQPGSGLSKSINIRDIQAPTAEEWASIVPNRANYRVVDYDPKKFLDNSKSVLPELFGKDADKPLLSDAVKEATEKKTNNDFTDTVKSIETSKAGGGYSKVNKIGAMGAYQFTPDTLDYINKVTGKNVTKEEFLKNPAIQDEYFKELTNANKTVLSKTGIAPTDFNAWAAHNLGVGSVRELLNTATAPSDRLHKFIKSNLPEGVEPTKENYIKTYAPKFGTTYAEVTNKVNVKDNPIAIKNAKMQAEGNKDIDWTNSDKGSELYTKDELKMFNEGLKLPAESKYPLNDELTKRKGGVGGEDPDKQAITQRIDEINAKLGANPAPTPENLALMDEKLKLAPRTIGDKIGSYANTLRRELIDPLGPSGYAVGGIPKVGATLSTGLSKLDDLLRPNKPLLLENLRPQGGANWTGTGRVATDKLNGISTDAVLGQAGNQGNRLLGALENAKEARGLLDEVKPTNLSTPNYFSNIKNQLDAPKLLEDLRRPLLTAPVRPGSPSWVNPKSVIATDKLNGKSAEYVISRSDPKVHSKLEAVTKKAEEARKELLNTKNTTVKDPNRELWMKQKQIETTESVAERLVDELINSTLPKNSKAYKELEQKAEEAISQYNRLMGYE